LVGSRSPTTVEGTSTTAGRGAGRSGGILNTVASTTGSAVSVATAAATTVGVGTVFVGTALVCVGTASSAGGTRRWLRGLGNSHAVACRRVGLAAKVAATSQAVGVLTEITVATLVGAGATGVAVRVSGRRGRAL